MLQTETIELALAEATLLQPEEHAALRLVEDEDERQELGRERRLHMHTECECERRCGARASTRRDKWARVLNPEGDEPGGTGAPWRSGGGRRGVEQVP